MMTKEPQEYIITEEKINSNIREYLISIRVPENHRDYILGRLRSRPYKSDAVLDEVLDIIERADVTYRWNKDSKRIKELRSQQKER